MPSVLELRNSRAKLVSDARKLLDAADAAKREMNPEEKVQWDKIQVDVDKLKVDIDLRERQEKLELELKNPAEQRGIGHQDVDPNAAPTDDQVKARKVLRARAHRKHLQGGPSTLSAEERSALELRATGESGITGYGVSDGFQVSIFDNLKYWSGVELAPITYKKTQSGNQYPMIISDDTSNTGTLLAENTQMASNVDQTLSQTTLSAYLFTSKAILVSMQALNDIEALEDDVVKNASIRIGRIRGSYFTTGSGTSQPTGVVTAATAAGLSVVGAAGQTTTLIADNLIDLIHQIDPAYRAQTGPDKRPSCGYMLHDTTFQAIKKLKDSYGRYLWNPGGGISGTVTDTLNGFPYYINNFMPTMAANAKSVVFGYWPAFVVRDVAEVIMLRLDQRYADSLQVGFIGAVRSDSKVAQTNAFAYYANSAT